MRSLSGLSVIFEWPVWYAFLFVYSLVGFILAIIVWLILRNWAPGTPLANATPVVAPMSHTLRASIFPGSSSSRPVSPKLISYPYWTGKWNKQLRIITFLVCYYNSAGTLYTHLVLVYTWFYGCNRRHCCWFVDCWLEFGSNQE